MKEFFAPGKFGKFKLDAYETAVNSHLRQSFVFDLIQYIGPIVPGQTRVGEVCSAAQKGRFLVIDYRQCYRPTDFSLWNGLGRFPKSSVVPDRIKGVLPEFEPSKIGVTDLGKVIQSEYEGNQLISQIVDWHRAALLQFLRAHHAQFQDRDI